jgi:hypothetical protein
MIITGRIPSCRYVKGIPSRIGEGAGVSTSLAPPMERLVGAYSPLVTFCDPTGQPAVLYVADHPAHGNVSSAFSFVRRMVLMAQPGHA